MDFEILERSTLYNGRIFDLQHLQVRLPTGKTRSYELVDLNGSVTILPFDEDGNIWFIRQYRLGAQQELLELPAGLLEKGEDPESGALRELREETGMSASKLVKIGEFFLAPGYSTEFMSVYLATGLAFDPLQADADEFLHVQKIPLKEVMEMVRRQEIKDGKSLAALMAAFPMIGTSAGI